MSQTSIINKKTGKRYTIYGIAKDAKDDSSGKRYAVYKDQDGTLYVREIEEFKEKFEEKPLTEHDIFW